MTHQPEIQNVIFDFGGVLVDWNPAYLYLKLFQGDQKAMEEFFDEVDFHHWNERADAGELFEDLLNEAKKKFPHRLQLLQAFYERFPETLGGPIEDVVLILKKLRERGFVRLYGLTNWSHETFYRVKKDFPFFEEFDGIVVSGEVQMKKPDPRIFRLTLERFGLVAEKSLFIDDKQANVDAAKKLGIRIHRFHSASDLEKDLVNFGLL